MSVEPQRALQHDPGRFRAFFTFEPLEMSAEGRRNLNIAAATLLKEVESDQLKDKPLNVLVAVSWDQLNDNQRLALEREYAACTENQHSGVLIQVAAET